MRLSVILSVVLALCPFAAQAINVGDITSMMGPDEQSLSKVVGNTTDSARFVSVTVQRLSSPMEGGVTIAWKASLNCFPRQPA